LPTASFDLVASALCVHHLAATEKADLFRRIRAVLPAGGRFVLGDVVIPAGSAEPSSPLTPGYDKPSTVADQLTWLADAGFDARLVWASGDLAVLVAVAS
jgi:tRNA (cmo5U34)-methyltransferase